MNMNDELLTRSLAALGEDTTTDSHVEQHLAEFQAAYAQLDDDPAAAAQLDNLIEDVDHELRKPGDELPDLGSGRDIELRERISELQKELLREMQARRGTPQEEPQNHRTRWVNRAKSLTPSLTSLATLLMIVGSVLLGMFGPFSHLGTSLVATIFAATAAVTVLLRSYALFYLSRHAVHGSKNAEPVMRLLLGGLSIELRNIEAREKVATSALQTAAPDQPVAVRMHEDHLELHRQHQ